MFRKVFSLIIGIMLLFPFNIGATVGTHVVINEIQIGGETSTDEYIRLYNPLNTDVSLLGYRLQKVTLSGSKYSLLTSFPELIIKSKGFLTVGHNNYKGVKDLSYSTSSSVAPDNAVILYSDAGKTAVDKLGLGKNTFGEGEPIPNPEDSEIYKRKSDGLDTDNNFADFSKVGDKVNEEIQEENSYSLQSIYINEMMPNPKSPQTDTSDEWIELYNGGNERIDLSGSILRDGVGSVREFMISNGTFIDAGRYATFYSSATKITLNNDRDFVEILDKNKNLVDSSPEYDKAGEGKSFSLFEDGWHWTKIPTPLSENILEEDEKDVQTASQKAEKKKASKTSKTKEKKEKASKKTKAVKGSSKKVNDKNEKDDKLGKVAKVLDWNSKNLGIFLLFLGAFLFYNYLIYRKDINEYFKQKFGGDS